MELHSTSSSTWLRSFLRLVRRHHLWALLIYSFALLLVGAYVHRSGILGNLVLPLLSENVQPLRRWIASFRSRPDQIHIHIKHEHFQKLAFIRQHALTNWEPSLPISQLFEYVPATIDHRGRTVRARIRLKGDRPIHYDHETNWSFRIRIRGEDTLFGMREFSIHHPRARNYVYGWLFHQLLKKEGLLFLRYRFITVTLNGRYLGVYALEEHFDKHLIENSGQREGPILRFNEDVGEENFFLSAVEPFNEPKPEFLPLYARATALLESFREGRLRVGETFDIQKLARFFAVTDLLGTHHAVLWKSMRFYYNPVTGKLEPVGFDAHYGTSQRHAIVAELGVRADAGWLFERHGPWFRLFFNNPNTFDPAFFREYVEALQRLAEASYLDEFFSQKEAELKQNLNIIYREFRPLEDHIFSFGPRSFTFSNADFYERQKYIRRILDPHASLHAYMVRRLDDGILVELGNTQSLPLEILGAGSGGQVILLPEGSSPLLKTGSLRAPTYRTMRLRLAEQLSSSEANLFELDVQFQVLGTGRFRQVRIQPFPRFAEEFVWDFTHSIAEVEEFEFLRVDATTKTLAVRPGRWTVTRDLVIPPGYRFLAGPATEINLARGSKILSHSPVEFRGSPGNPVIVRSVDASGEGVAVLGAGKGSVLEDVTFDNLANPSAPGWSLTGAVTFYESPVAISHCLFARARSEDSLNIIRSDFTIDETLFTRNLFDALDVDFASGQITRSIFVDSGNDGIDVSGAMVTLKHVRIEGAGDKGISAGEVSHVTGSHVRITDSEIAMASKDTSHVVLSGVTIASCKVGLAVFQKKPEFGAGSVELTSVSITETDMPYLVEEGSKVNVEGKAIPPGRTDVAEILYGAQYGRPSR